MRRRSIVLYCLCVATSILLLSACNNQPAPNNTGGTAAPMGYSSVHLPQDVLPTCTISPDSFNAWFAGRKATENGAVTPANSVTFQHNDNCDFYQWAERMFLWMTSPASGTYGSGGTVLESSLFYTVIVDSAGGRHLMPHLPGQPLSAVGSIQKNGPNRLPVFRDKTGRLFEVQFHKPGEKVMVKNSAGQIIELGAIQKSTSGPTLLMDKGGKAIAKPAFVTNFVNPDRVLHAFSTATGTVFFDNNGNEVDTGLGQATNQALMTTSGSLVYYITMVNDMYAYFLTGVKNKKLSGRQFPTTAGARDSIVAYARSLGYDVPSDANTLAIEIKSSWVPVDSLINAANYVTIDASVPTYDTSNPKKWVPNGQKVIKLALVGIHIVGSVSGHPEMIWATFEHNTNSPDSAYQYLDRNGHVQTVPSDTGNFMFSTAAGGPFNQSHISVSKEGNILTPDSPFTSISPSNTQRVYPFGVAYGVVPNQQDTSSSASNSEIIGINDTIINQIPGADRRKSYFLVGATWTFGGVAPTGKVYPLDNASGASIGTSNLANSTMETYFQAADASCLFCHSRHINSSLDPDVLSHIFKDIKPLLPASK